MNDSILDDEIYEAANNEAVLVRKAIKEVGSKGRVFDGWGRYTQPILEEIGVKSDPLWFTILKYIILVGFIYLAVINIKL